MVFNGMYDGSMPVSVQEIMVKNIPNCRAEVVEHGHGSWFFDSKLWDIVIEFLKKE
ncbi:hypothetical protein [Anaerotignum sp.]|uniref:hypothetical protein n=1 Tax=Anaerotignum sp. TaxID=2039241 RepID=UPI0027146185|nr:hypothetical protein [Anaerotignum sp.]